jgi:fibronectin type 3 domain-containing protein
LPLGSGSISAMGIWRSSSEDGTYSLLSSLSTSAVSYTDTGLTENTEYWYEIKTTDATGTATSDPLDTWTLPLAPSALSVSMSDGQAILSWTNNSASAPPLYVEQSTDGTNFTIIDEIDGATAAYTDAYPSDGISDYRIAAVNGDGTAFNASTSASLASALLAPSDLTTEAVSASEVDLTWTNNSTAADGITILRETNGAGGYSAVATISDPTTDAYADTGLTAGTNYSYEIEATQTGASPSAASSAADDTTTPPVPTGLSVAVVAASSMTQPSSGLNLANSNLKRNTGE